MPLSRKELFSVSQSLLYAFEHEEGIFNNVNPQSNCAYYLMIVDDSPNPFEHELWEIAVTISMSIYHPYCIGYVLARYTFCVWNNVYYFYAKAKALANVV